MIRVEKIMHKKVGGLDTDVEQVPSSGRLVVGYTRFDEMAVAIQLMLHL